jgi:hypothetical protein
MPTRRPRRGCAGRRSLLARGAGQTFHLRVVSGPGAGQGLTASGERTTVGTHPSVDLRLDDRAVSGALTSVRRWRHRARTRTLELSSGGNDWSFVEQVKETIVESIDPAIVGEVQRTTSYTGDGCARIAGREWTNGPVLE